MVQQYRSAQSTLRDERAALQDAKRAVRAGTAALRNSQVETRHAVRRTMYASQAATLARAQRTYFDGLRRNTTRSLGQVGVRVDQSEIAIYAVAAHANGVTRCLDGVSKAIAHVAGGNHERAVGSLNRSAKDCAKTIALTTGSPFPYDFPDPFVLSTGDEYYAYATNSGGGEVQVIRSDDLASWELVGDGLANVPRWAERHTTWAPAVLARPGGYVLYYTVRHAASGRQCISRAAGRSPAGPFIDDSVVPLVCQLEHGGSIDPSPYVDPAGQAWLLWKSEGFGTMPASLWSQPLASDGRSFVGAARALLSADRRFEARVIEAPSLARVGGRYVLLYSSGDWKTRDYNVAYATCASPAGPCTKPYDGRLLRSGSRAAGPGGAEFFRTTRGAPWVAFHAFSEPDVGYPNSRYVHLAALRWSKGRLVIGAQL
jgi:beta-xylosidase